MEETGKQTMKLPVMPAKMNKIKYAKWLLNWSSYLLVKGMQSAMEGIPDLPDKHTDVEPIASTIAEEEANKIKKAIKTNDLVVAMLRLAAEKSDRAISVLQRGVTEDWPNGKATLMITSLNKKFGAKAGFQGINLRDKLHAVKWKASGGLEELIEDIAAVRALAIQMKDTDLKDKDYVGQLVKQVPAEYRLAVNELVKAGSTDYDDYEDALESFHNDFNLEDDDEDSEDEKETETVLTTTAFKGKCFNCHKYGHRANKCPQKGTGNVQGNSKFTGTCDLCGKRGHKKAACWEDEANADKRPKNWKKGAAMAGVEIMLCSFADMQYDSDESSCYSDMPELVERPESSSDEESSDDDVPPLMKRGDSSSEYTDTSSDDDASDASEYYHFDVKDCYTYGRCDTSEYYFYPSQSTEKGCGYALEDESLSDYKEENDREVETSLLSTKDVVEDPYFFIADSGASNDMKINMEGIKNKRESNGWGIISSNGGVKEPNAIADYDFTQYDKQGRKVQDGTMTDVCVGAGTFNLFSITKRLQNGWKLSGSNENLTLRKGNSKLVFDQKVKVGSSYLFGTILKPRTEVAAPSLVKKAQGPIRVSVTKAHNIFGHLGENDCRAAVKASGYELKSGSFGQCVSCAVAKAKQKSLAAESEGERSEVPNERIYLDLVTLKPPRGTKVTKANPIWRIMVDDATRTSFSTFHPKKNAYLEPTCVYLDNWKQNGQPVKYVRMDNAPENKKFIELANSRSWKLNLTAEMTGANTPQRNGPVERKIATLLGRARATAHNAELNDKNRALLGNELVNYCEKMDWLVPIDKSKQVKPRIVHWCGKLPQYAKHLRTWGEAGVVKTRTIATNKIQDCGEVMMFVGYNVNMGGDVLRMWCERTKRVHCTRDITWLNVYYFNRDRKVDSNRPEQTVGENVHVDDADTVYSVDTEEDNEESNNDDDGTASVNDDEEDNDDDDDRTGNQVGENDTRMAKETVFEPKAKTRSGRVSTPAAKLGEWAHVAKAMQLEGEPKTYLEALQTLKGVEFACVGAGVGGGFDNTAELKPMKYKEAMATKDKKAWEIAVEKEHDNMTNYDVWTPVKLRDVPKDAKVLTSTWAMKKKSNGTFRARLNARGYEEVDGVHYDASSVAAPVTNELTIRICMTLMLMAGWLAHVLDVKGAFLRGEFEPNMPKMYMKVPEGFEKYYPKDTVLLLLKTIYGLKEAAAAFWKQILKAFGYMGFSRSKADPCLYYKWTAAGYLMMWLSWVDDCVCFGRETDVKESAKEMNELFECDDIGDFEEYVGCKVDRKGSELKMTQPVLLQSFEDEFDIGDVRDCETPATSNTVLAEAKDSETLNATWQTKFRSGVGKLLHMMRWSRPEIYNAVRDLSKHGGKCTSAHIKAMKRVMKYCVSSKQLGWKLKPERKWDGKDKSFKFRIKGKSDSDFACDPSRRSVTGLCVFLEGVAVSVKSVMQKIVALSVTEAETIAAVQCAQEMMLTYKILTSMGLKVELPMILEVDNKGAVDLANNWSHGGRTKHMEVRNYWLRELKEQGLLKVVWTSGVENAADIFTKNLPAEAFKKHRQEFVG